MTVIALLHRPQVGECINGIDGGYITSPQIQDIVVQTYPGKVSALVMKYQHEYNTIQNKTSNPAPNCW